MRLITLAFFMVFSAISMDAHAQRLRLHGVAAGARAVGGHQEQELSWGGAGSAAAELVLAPQLGLQLGVGAVALSEGEPPADPLIEPEGDASALYASAGIHLRPFATDPPGESTAASGFWISASAGPTRTGGLLRLMADAHLGYDFLVADGTWGIGPMIGLFHVFQPDTELRPADANVLLFGIHVMIDPARPTPRAAPSKSLSRPVGDRDGDGIPDDVDRCPDEPEDFDGFEDEDGCPDPDNDGDGIPDDEDLCPNEPETFNDYADHDGCPDSEQIRVVGDKIVLDDRVHFRVNSGVIWKVSYPLLERLARLILEHPEYLHVEIQGHADQRGSEEYNQRLSEERARSVLEFLVKQGVPRDRLSAVGYGKSRPLVDKNDERAWFLNRRVEFRITRKVKEVVRSGPEGTVTEVLPVDPNAAPARGSEKEREGREGR